MKKIFSLICIALFTLNANANDEKIVKSTISKVTVYSQGAQIYRKSSYSVSKGVTEVIIEGISPYIDQKSLQVQATGNAIILDSKYSLYYPTPEEIALEGLPLKTRRRILSIEDSIYNINYDIQALQDEINVLNATKNILTNNGAIKGQGKVNDSIALLKEAIEYYTVKMMDINKKLLVLNRKMAKSTKNRNGMNQRLTDLRNQQSNNANQVQKGPIYRVTVTLKAMENISGKLNISYLVSNAGWVPIYDLKSESTAQKINLNYKAQVYQNTGVDWDDVRLNISTNNPFQNKTKPELHPWYVDFYAINTRNDEYKKNKKGNIQQAEAYGFSTPQSATVTYSEDASIELDAVYSDKFVQVVDHLISAEFRIDLPYSIKSNNQKHLVLIKNVDLDAVYKYYTVPKFDNSVYLVAQLVKLDELQLVPAKANIFFDGSYIGETYLDPNSMDDTLNLSLGKDPNIIVKRTFLKHESKEKIVGTKIEKTYSYAIEVKNLKSKSIELVVQDQMPITQNAEIEIEAEDISKGKLEERTGIIEWKFTLKPKGSKDIQLKYKIKHDKDQNMSL